MYLYLLYFGIFNVNDCFMRISAGVVLDASLRPRMKGWCWATVTFYTSSLCTKQIFGTRLPPPLPCHQSRSVRISNTATMPTMLQAVVLADSYDERFIPMSHEMPRVRPACMSPQQLIACFQCLMPLCNIPLIEYTMEVLSVLSKVENVFIVCTSHIDQNKKHFE